MMTTLVYSGILTVLMAAGGLAGPTLEGLEAATEKTSHTTKDLDFNACPWDTTRTENEHGEVVCVCEPKLCKILECPGSILPTPLREPPGTPGRCCTQYVCPQTPGGRSFETSDEHEELCHTAGRSYGLNEVWKDEGDACKECRCEERGKIRCQTPMCRSTCSKPLREGQCCPVCDDEATGSFNRPNKDCPYPIPNATTCDLVKNKSCKDGLVMDPNGCIHCACKNGEVSHIPRVETPISPPGDSEFVIDDPQCTGGFREYCLDPKTRCTCTSDGKGEQAICTSVVQCVQSPHYVEGGAPNVETPATSDSEAQGALCKAGPREFCWNSTTKCTCDNGRAYCEVAPCTSSFVEDAGHEWNSTLVAVIAVLAVLCVILSVCLVRQCRHRRQTMSPHTVDIISIPAPQRNLNLNLKSYCALPTK